MAKQVHLFGRMTETANAESWTTASHALKQVLAILKDAYAAIHKTISQKVRPLATTIIVNLQLLIDLQGVA